jgi:hypothetical protein
MHLKIVAERQTAQLLGAQIAGGKDGGKRIDVLATALCNGMTVRELVGVDEPYAPPFSPVWNLVLLADLLNRKTPSKTCLCGERYCCSPPDFRASAGGFQCQSEDADCTDVTLGRACCPSGCPSAQWR